MVQKMTRIMVLAVFALLSTGVVATVHLCQDQIKGLAWFSSEKKTCPCPDTDDMSGCCDTLLVHFEHDDVAPSAPTAIPADLIVGTVEPIITPVTKVNQSARSSMMEQVRAPDSVIPRWLLYGDLRIPDAC
jgi:hypothetical protein